MLQIYTDKGLKKISFFLKHRITLNDFGMARESYRLKQLVSQSVKVVAALIVQIARSR